MDSEHRHELAENDLARILMGWSEKLSSYRGPIVAGLVAIVVIAIGASVMRSQSAAATKEAWQKLSSAQIPENFGAVADDYPGTEVAAWAKVNEGRLYLREGIREAFTDKETSTTALESARKAFEVALESAAAPPEVRERALYGLAIYTESVSDGDTSKAVAAYKRLVSEFPDAASRKYAESRIEALESEKGQEFYAWFSEQEPKREAPASPLDSGARDSTIPPPPSIGAGAETDTGDGEEMTKTEEKPTEEETAESETAEGKPKGDAAEKAEASEEKPTGDKTAAEAATAEKPDAEKPTSEQPAAETPAENTSEDPGANEPASE